MFEKIKPYLGFVLVTVLLAMIIEIMRESGQEGVLNEVLPRAFLAMVALVIAGIAAMIFRVAATKIKLPSWLGVGTFSATGGVAVFVVTLLILLPDSTRTSTGAPQPSVAKPSFTVQSGAYLSTFRDGRHQHLPIEEQPAVVQTAWDSAVGLELVLQFENRVPESQRVAVQSVEVSLNTIQRGEAQTRSFSFICRGVRDGDSIHNPDAEWHNCRESTNTFDMESGFMGDDFLFKSNEISWRDFIENTAEIDADHTLNILVTVVFQVWDADTPLEISQTRTCEFDAGQIHDRTVVARVPKTVLNSQYGIDLQLECT